MFFQHLVLAAARAGDRVARFLQGLSGFSRFLVALASGLLSALAFAPFGFFPLLLLSLAVLVILLDIAQVEPQRLWRSAAIGWAYGFGQFLAGLYWVAYAFLVDPLQHAWQIPFVALLFPGGLALFVAAGCAAYAALWRDGPARVFVFAGCYAIAEWLRGHILTGFPWNLAGYAWGASLAILQSVSWFGVYGLTLLTLLLGASLALLCAPRSRSEVAVPAAVILLFFAFWVFGAMRLATLDVPSVPGVRLRIVQPNVPQDEKYIPALRASHWHELMELSLAKSALQPTHIIWPEAAPPFLLAREPAALSDIAALTGDDKVLITGAVRADFVEGKKPAFFNSLYVFGHGGRLLATYDKFHLVPFGEYVPFPKTLHAIGVDKLVNQPGSFASGSGLHTYSAPGAPPFGPLICYEILFPGDVTAERRPSWLVNVTDDSWFGPPSSSGPYQHFLTARVRAIEEGIPVVRAANTGISAVIDPLGRVTAKLDLDRMGAIDAPLPNAVPSTLFSRLGNWVFLLMLLSCILAAYARCRRA